MGVKKTGSISEDDNTSPPSKIKRITTSRKTAPKSTSSQRARKADPTSKPKRARKAKPRQRPSRYKPIPHDEKKPTGPKPLYERVTDEQLKNICDLLRTGRASLEDSVRVNICASDTSIDRSQAAGMQALHKMEDGGELDEREQKALNWYSAITMSMAHGAILLTRQATGDRAVVIARDEDGREIHANNDPRFSANVLKILQLTRKHWRPVLETKVQVQSTLAGLTDDELFAKEAALRAAIGQDE